MIRSKLGLLCMLLGTMLTLAALSLFLYNDREAAEAGTAAESVTARLQEQLDTVRLPSEEAETEEDAEMTVVEIDGYGYIGYLSIPSLDLELPVMSEWSYAGLKIAPCRYTGSVGTDDLVIAAHNYARHFGQLKSLTAGDLVYFTDMDGTLWSYEVAEVEILEPTAVEEMTAGEYDLTLFTCTYGGASRVTVRCNRIAQ